MDWSLDDWSLDDWSLAIGDESPADEPQAGGSRHPRHRPRNYIEDVIPTDDDEVLVLLALSR